MFSIVLIPLLRYRSLCVAGVPAHRVSPEGGHQAQCAALCQVLLSLFACGSLLLPEVTSQVQISEEPALGRTALLFLQRLSYRGTHRRRCYLSSTWGRQRALLWTEAGGSASLDSIQPPRGPRGLSSRADVPSSAAQVCMGTATGRLRSVLFFPHFKYSPTVLTAPRSPAVSFSTVFSTPEVQVLDTLVFERMSG